MIEIDWETELKLENNDVNFSFDRFLEILNNTFDKHAPYKTLSKSKMKTFSQPWITQGILKSIKIKNNLYKQLCKAKNSQNKIYINQKFKQYRNLIKTLTRRSKNNNYYNYFYSNKKNLRKTWQGIKNIINLNNNNTSLPNCLNKGRRNLTDPVDIANEFNGFFSEIGKKLETKIIKTDITYDKLLKNPNEKSFFMKPTSEEEVKYLILNLNPHKSTGPSSFPTKILKYIVNIISKPVCDLVNMSMSNGTFPDTLKIAEVIPIFKKGDKLSCNNYRPISLLSNLSKIFEKVLHERTYNFLNECNLFYNLQFGFRHKHSTNHALIKITELIRRAIDNKNIACSVFIDLQKAFDTVNHKILLHKLKHYGIRGKAYKLFESYLSNRYQYVSINGSYSKKLLITHGVPQGSVLGPLLFIIFINDLNYSVVHSVTHHFADDTNLLYVNDSLKKINKYINHDLKLITVWLRANKIALNASKTGIVLFRSKSQTIKKHLNFRISGQRIEPKQQVKYLGIILDEHLNWDTHFSNLKFKLNRAIGMLAKIRHYVVSLQTLKNIYFSIFHSHLIYGCQIWGQVANASLNRTQNKALRVISFKHPTANSNALYFDLKILRYQDYIEILNCFFVYDCMKNILPKAFKDMFNYVDHGYNTRAITKKHLKLPYVKTTKYGINSITYNAINTWNKLINKNISSEDMKRNELKRLIHNFLISKYSQT